MKISEVLNLPVKLPKNHKKQYGITHKLYFPTQPPGFRLRSIFEIFFPKTYDSEAFYKLKNRKLISLSELKKGLGSPDMKDNKT
jgi:hypothetical protein